MLDVTRLVLSETEPDAEAEFRSRIYAVRENLRHALTRPEDREFLLDGAIKLLEAAKGWL